MRQGPHHQLDHATLTIDKVGRSYYCFCMEQALVNVRQAIALMSGDKIVDDHELPKIKRLLEEALEAA